MDLGKKLLTVGTIALGSCLYLERGEAYPQDKPRPPSIGDVSIESISIKEEPRRDFPYGVLTCGILGGIIIGSMVGYKATKNNYEEYFTNLKFENDLLRASINNQSEDICFVKGNI